MDHINSYIKNHGLSLSTDGIKSKYICQICEGVLCNPTITRCIHSFCSNCLKKHLKTRNKNCPICNQKINEREIYPDFRMEEKISVLNLDCPNTLCCEKVALKDMKNHLESCDNKGYSCPLNVFGCSVMCKAQIDIKLHIMDDLIGHLDKIIKYTCESKTLMECVQYNNLEILKKLDEGVEKAEHSVNDVEVIKASLAVVKQSWIDVMKQTNENNKKIVEETNKNQTLKQELQAYSAKLEIFEKENTEFKNKIKKLLDVNMKIFQQLESFQEKINELEDHNEKALITNQKLANVENENLELKNNLKELTKTDQENLELKEKLEKFSEIEKENWELKNQKNLRSIAQSKEIKFTNIFQKRFDHYDYSEIFMLNQYSFVVAINKASNNVVYFKLCSVWNENISKLVWPIPFKINLELKNSDNYTLYARSFFPDNTIQKPRNGNYSELIRINKSFNSISSDCYIILSV